MIQNEKKNYIEKRKYRNIGIKKSKLICLKFKV